jgi:hypothetical protein
MIKFFVMKKVRLFTKGKLGVLGMMCMAATLFSSCLKDHENNYVEQPAALVSVINALPGSQPVDFYLDQNRANPQAIPFGYGLDYLKAATGKRTAAFYVSGVQQALKSDTMTLKKDNFYTVYLAGTTTQPDLVLLHDSIARPASGKATIRLVNMSTNAGAVDLVIKDGAILAANKGYKGSSPFVAVQSGMSYTLEIHQAGTSTVLASLSNVQLNSNAIYTIWLQGLAGATDQTKLTAKLQNNVYYN